MCNCSIVYNCYVIYYILYYLARQGTVPSVDDSGSFSMRKADWKDRRGNKLAV